MEKVLITGGRLRPDAYELGDGKYYQEAILALVDLHTGTVQTLISKKEGNQHYPAEHPNLQFTAACLDDDTLWLPTDTEVLAYRLPDMVHITTYSHPSFQNIHSVAIYGDELAVTSTGLDNVVILDKQTGDIKRIVNTEGKDPWHRFDKGTDYRLVHTTKPHDSHPNFTFKHNDEIWVTRCTQEDAVCLSDLNKRINISGDDCISVHDGIVSEGHVYFTRVDGFIVKASLDSQTVVEQIDIFANDEKMRVKGWCRGLHLDGDLCYIGFSKLRKTRLKQKLKYLAQGQFNKAKVQNAAVVVFNLKTRRVEQVISTTDMPLDSIYTVLPFRY